jgi:ribosomal-protein-alanine N-acetyltransferase
MSTGFAEKQDLRVHIRWMIRRDMPEVLQIEETSYDYPWTEEDFLRCLRQRNCIGMVAELGEKVVGFMIYELHKTRLHILNFSVAAGVRHRSVGTQMIDKLVGKLSSQRRTEISLEVRETNLGAQLFFRKAGFKATNVLRDFYDDSTEDAYVMQYCYKTEPAEMILPLNRIDRRMAG